MTTPLVSIIILNYNYGRFLNDAIDSALVQTYRDIEVIVVDDGSADHSLDIILNYGDRIKVILKKNGGQGSALNAGYAVSTGALIIILDADDRLLPGAVAETVKCYTPATDVKVHWPMWRIDEDGKRNGKRIPEGELVEGDLKHQLISLGPAHCGGPPESPPTSGNAWSGKFLESILPINEEVFKGGVDHYLFVMAPLFGYIRRIKEPLGEYRVHGTNNTLKPGYMTTFFSRFEFCCRALSHQLEKQGIKKSPDEWPRDHWFHKMDTSLKEINQLLPEDSAIILLDDDAWTAGQSVSGRKRFYFFDNNGYYGGVAQSDDDAINELNSLKSKGAGFLVITWSSFWWLDYLKKFNSHIRNSYPVMLENDRLIIFDVTSNNAH